MFQSQTYLDMRLEEGNMGFSNKFAMSIAEPSPVPAEWQDKGQGQNVPEHQCKALQRLQFSRR